MYSMVLNCVSYRTIDQMLVFDFIVRLNVPRRNEHREKTISQNRLAGTLYTGEDFGMIKW